jgi:hypothetical protein
MIVNGVTGFSLSKAGIAHTGDAIGSLLCLKDIPKVTWFNPRIFFLEETVHA